MDRLAGLINEESTPTHDNILRGSYSQHSFISLTDMNKSSFLPANNINLNHNQNSSPSKKSYSFMRLENLAHGKEWEEEKLEDFALEELRNEFFDSIYTKPEKLIDFSDDEDDFSHTTTNNNKQGYDDDKNTENKYKKKIAFLYRVKNSNSLTKYIPGPIQIRDDFMSNKYSIFKYFCAYFIAMVICVIHPSGNWIGGKFRYFMLLSVLIHHPIRNVGVQLEITLFSILGGAFGMGWSSLAWYVSTVSKPVASYQGAMLFTSLLIALCFSVWIAAIFQRLLYFCKTFSIAIIFFHTADLSFSKDLLKWRLYWDFGISYLFGLLLSLIICICIFPHCGNQELTSTFSRSLRKCNHFLVSLVDLENDIAEEYMEFKRKDMVNFLIVDLSEAFREFSNQMNFSRFDQAHLKEFRNSITKFISPLRILPTHSKLFTKENIKDLYASLKSPSIDDNPNNSIPSTPMTFSERATPQPMDSYTGNHEKGLDQQLYLELLRTNFAVSTYALISEMIYALEQLTEVLKEFEKTNKRIDAVKIEKKMDNLSVKLKRRIYKLDVKYKTFTNTEYFSKELLTDTSAVDIFLFLRTLRNSAKHMLNVFTACTTLCHSAHWRIKLISYPLHRAIYRLPYQCSVDEGSGNVLNYFETKRDVDEIFEKLYNIYTSTHKFDIKEKDVGHRGSIRASDHDDFNLHTTSNKWRFKLWKFSKLLVADQMKWTMKKVFVIVFLCLPTWLPRSYGWYQKYQCWWAPLIFYLLSHRKYSGNWDRLARRIIFCLIGIFWGWAANQARHFGSPYVICTFTGILVIPITLNIFAYKNTRSSFTTMLCFSVIVMESYSKGKDNLNTAGIWKDTWVTGLALFIGTILSIPVNWIVWSFRARSELRISISVLLAHISQSYQIVTDRYLYRDSDDAPTEFAIALSHIREIRLSQSIEAIRELLEKSKEEPIYIANFKPIKYSRMLDLCEYLLEKIIEARISSTYFEVWDRDADPDITRALLSLRRDSVSSVIFVLYILSNCFRSKNKVPRYLPNPVLSRKKLYEFILKFEHRDESKRFSDRFLSNNNLSLIDKKLISRTKSYINETDEIEKSHWTEIHRVAFERAFTDISTGIHEVIVKSKEILGEESY